MNTLCLIPAVNSLPALFCCLQEHHPFWAVSLMTESKLKIPPNRVRSQHEYTAFDTCCEESASSTQNHSSAVCIISQLRETFSHLPEMHKCTCIFYRTILQMLLIQYIANVLLIQYIAEACTWIAKIVHGLLPLALRNNLSLPLSLLTIASAVILKSLATTKRDHLSQLWIYVNV